MTDADAAKSAGPDGAESAGVSAAARDRFMRLATYASVAVASTLILLKGAAYYKTGSVAMLASLVDSGLDLLASGVTLVAVRQALVPPDSDHRFGHGKAEALAGLMQSVLVTGSALFILLEALEKLERRSQIEHSYAGIAVILVSIALTFALVAFQRFVVRRTGSLAVMADRLHYTGDLLTNLGVVVALVVAGVLGHRAADPLIGILIAGYIAWTASSILRHSFDQLMDREMADAERERILKIIAAHADVMSVHDLRTRRSGTRCFIQFHLELDGAISLLAAHRIADEVETALHEAYPQAEVFIHTDPAGLEATGRTEPA